MKRQNKSPFASEDEERDYWSNADSSEMIDWKNAKRVRFPSLQPSTKSISLRLPEFLLNDIKMLARKSDVPYQSLIKMILVERVNYEMKRI